MKSPVTLINEALKRAGRDERLVRSRGGYWRLHGGDASRLRESGFYGYSPHLSTVASSLSMIRDRFEENGVAVDLKEAP